MWKIVMQVSKQTYTTGIHKSQPVSF